MKERPNNCNSSQKYYFNTSYSQPCCCTKDSLCKAFKLLLTYPLGFSKLNVYPLISEEPIINDDDVIEVENDFLRIISDSTDTRCPLCNLQGAGFNVNYDLDFVNFLSKYYSGITNCSKPCCCNQGIINNYANGTVYEFYINSDPLHALGPITGSIVAYDCEVLFIHDGDTGTSFNFYIIPICSIAYISKSLS